MGSADEPAASPHEDDPRFKSIQLEGQPLCIPIVQKEARFRVSKYKMRCMLVDR